MFFQVLFFLHFFFSVEIFDYNLEIYLQFELLQNLA